MLSNIFVAQQNFNVIFILHYLNCEHQHAEKCARAHCLGQGFSTFFYSWPTKLVRNGVGPLTFNEKHQVSCNFEFMVEIEFMVENLCGILKTASWPIG